MPFFLIFIIIPLIEIYLFMNVGDEIGVLPTLLACFLTALLGASLVRKQGIETFTSAQHSLSRQEIPVLEIFEGVCLVIAGTLLVTPGFFTDAVGFFLLIPAARRSLYSILEARTETMKTKGRRPHDPTIIEGEFETVDPEQIERGKPEKE